MSNPQDDTMLSVRLRNICHFAGIDSADKLHAALDSRTFHRLRGAGTVTVNEAKQWCDCYVPPKSPGACGDCPCCDDFQAVIRAQRIRDIVAQQWAVAITCVAIAKGFAIVMLYDIHPRLLADLPCAVDVVDGVV